MKSWCTTSIDGLCVKERELRDRRGRWHRLQVRPYETAENKIAGAVLILFDIDDAKRSNDRLKHAGSYADAIIETVREPLLVLDGELADQAGDGRFLQKFRVLPQADGRRSSLRYGNRQWDIPALRSLLEDVLPRNTRVTRFQGRARFSEIGKKTMLLNARRVDAAGWRRAADRSFD